MEACILLVLGRDSRFHMQGKADRGQGFPAAVCAVKNRTSRSGDARFGPMQIPGFTGPPRWAFILCRVPGKALFDNVLAL